AFAALEAAEALLVLGSSLTVQSGLRFARAARRQDMPVVIVNDGPTRADAEAALRVHGRLEDVLADWAAIVGVQDPGGPPQRAGEVRERSSGAASPTAAWTAGGASCITKCPAPAMRRRWMPRSVYAGSSRYRRSPPHISVTGRVRACSRSEVRAACSSARDRAERTSATGAV